MREVLHWFLYPQRISYRIVSLAWRCLFGRASAHLRELCPLFLLMLAAAVRCDPLSHSDSHSPALRQRRALPFLRPAKQPDRAFVSFKAPTKTVLVFIFIGYFFLLAWVGRVLRT